MKKIQISTVTIVLPTYNEIDNIVPLINEIITVLKLSKLKGEILIVDDNSPDGTAKKVLRIFRKNPQISVKLRLKNRGLAASIAEGIKESRYNTVIVMDTDFNHDPKIIPQLVHSLQFADMSIGSRFVTGGGMEDQVRLYLSYIFNLFVRLYLQLPTKDSLSGFFAIRKTTIKPFLNPGVFSGFGEYFIRLIYLLHRGCKTFKEIPVFYTLRPHGKRKSEFVKMFISYTYAILQLKKNKLQVSKLQSFT